MRNFSFLVLASLVVAAGCDGCAFPFSTTSQGTIRLSLHKVAPNCDDDGSPPETDDNGTPDDTSDDTIVSWEQVADIDDNDDTPDCRISSLWDGVLLDMAAVRTGVNEAVTNAGFDPATVRVEITSLAVEVDDVKLIDDVSGDSDPDVTGTALPAVLSYLGGVRPDGDELQLVSVTTEGGTINEPITNVESPERLTALANDALVNNTSVRGDGSADLVADLDQTAAFAAFAALTNPTLLITLTFGVNGDAIVGGPPAE